MKPQWVISWIVTIGLLSLPELSFGQDEHYVFKAGTFVGKVNPDTEVVDHSRYFLETIDQQVTGSCHVHAATALIEAFCKKVTGKSIDISESYFFYRHFRNQLEQMGMFTLSADDLVSNVARGTTMDTIERFQNGSVCTKDEFNMSDSSMVALAKTVREFSKTATARLKGHYEAANSKAVQTCKSMAELDKSLHDIRLDFNRAFREMVCVRLDGAVKCKLKPENIEKNPKNIGVVLETKNPDLLNCLQVLDTAEVITAPSTEKIMEILKGGDPVACLGKFVFPPNSGIKESNIIKLGGHSTIIYGYRKNPGNAKPEFLIRDSNFSTLNPYTVTGCNKIVVLRQKKRNK